MVIVKRLAGLLLVYVLSHVAVNAQLQAYKSSARGESFNFLLYEPQDVSSATPLVVFLHGGGEGGDNVELVKKHGLPKLIDQGRSFPFYMLAPQSPYESGFWDDRMVDEMVDRLVDSLNIDVKRIYLTGLSRGGYGVWRMAVNNPKKYAAMISVCAASIPLPYVRRLSHLPVWLFHGDADPVIPTEQSVQAYELMKPNNDKVKLTIYPGVGHDSWVNAFEKEPIYEWLLSQKLE
ncbi:MAG: dienelactone hydrolase family protein [Cyclobacteriaceae bacterium]